MKEKAPLLDRIDDNIVILSIRQGFVMAIPALMVGSMALVLKFLPVPVYQRFIQSFASGFLVDLFTWLNLATFGTLSVCITVSISMNYALQHSQHSVMIFGTMFSAVASFFILSGILSGASDFNVLGIQGMFTAIFSAIVFSAFFCALVKSEKFNLRLYTLGADRIFNSAISIIFPCAIVILAAFLFNTFIEVVFKVSGFNALFHSLTNRLFSVIRNSPSQAVVYVLLSSFLWFLGIHGSNILDGISDNILVANMDLNVAAVQAGGQPVEIFSKTFLDVFVLMGGCGATLCLLGAILLFGKQKNIRRLAKMAGLPMLFNVNELMVFGLPLVYNLSFFVPFLLTPMVCTATAYLAIRWGLVPIPMNPVEWVTPIGIGGYIATGSISGTLLQFFNLAVGIFIYRFFLKRYEAQNTARIKTDLSRLVRRLQEAEKDNTPITLLEVRGNQGAMAKMLAEDLRYVLKSPESFQLYYQPQYNSEDEFIGAEALIRWNHPRFGMIYPPLLMGIARETNLLKDLEWTIFQMAARDTAELKQEGFPPFKVSVNITSPTLQDPGFPVFLKRLLAENSHMRNYLSIELTEQMSFSLGDAMEKHLQEIREMGVSLAIDDFSMGHTSLKYLKSSHFDLVKLDGSLIQDMITNPRNEEIISSIMHMSRSMGFKVMAEFVETVEQRDKLKSLGCRLYQGYLFSPAIPLEKLVELLRRPGLVVGSLRRS